MESYSIEITALDRNWVLYGKQKNHKVFRCLGASESDYAMIEIGRIVNNDFKPHPAPENPSYRSVWSATLVAQRLANASLVSIEERGIPTEMRNFTDVAPLDAVDSAEESAALLMAKKRAYLLHMDKSWGVNVLFNPDIYREAISQSSALVDIPVSTARIWYERHLFYGRHANALIPQHWGKGGKGVLRRGLKDETGKPCRDLGRRTDHEKTNPNSKYKRRRLLPALYNAWVNFITMQAWESDDGIGRIYDKFLVHGFAGHNLGDDQKTRSHEIDPKFLPTSDYMKEVGRPILRMARAKRERAYAEAAGKKKGRARILSNLDLTVFDIDGTTADNNITLFGKEFYVDGRGKPTILGAVDRESTAIVGWVVTFGNENADAYKACLFSAYTPKDRELAHWDMSHLAPGMVYGCASKIFVDRGPGKSHSATMMIVNELRAAGLMASPRNPRGKGHAEQIMAGFQEAASDLPGSTYPTGDLDRDGKRMYAAKKGESVPFEDFMKRFLQYVFERNMTREAKRGAFSEEMLKADLRPIPRDVFVFNQMLRRGDAASHIRSGDTAVDQDIDWPEERIYKVLCPSDERVASNGYILFKKHNYTSIPFQHFCTEYHRIYSRWPTIRFHILYNAPSMLLWMREDGHLSILEMDKQEASAFNYSTIPFLDFVNKLKNAKMREAKEDARTLAFRARKQALMSRSKTLQMLEAEGRGVNPLPALDIKTAKKRMQRQNELVAAHHQIERMANLPISQPVRESELPTQNLTPSPIDNARDDDDREILRINF